MNCNERFHQYKSAIELALNEMFQLPQNNLMRAMAYSVLEGGKRIRPILLLAACDTCQNHWQQAIPYACALELIHSYSLIHDDLPAMDDDSLRRGRATNHVVFGEAMAILAGDGLLSLAFEIMTRTALDSDAPLLGLKAMGEIAHGCGVQGMVLGQVYDLEQNTQMEIEKIHLLKTGALLSAAMRAGASLAGAETKQIERMGEFGKNLGIAFQIRDDLLDVVSSSSELGKTPGKDQALGKRTAIAAYGGIEAAQKQAEWYESKACLAIQPYDTDGFFAWIIDQLAGRDR